MKKLEQLGQCFLKFFPCVLNRLNVIIVCSLFEKKKRYLFLCVLGALRVLEEGLRFKFTTALTRTRSSHHDVAPLDSFSKHDLLVVVLQLFHYKLEVIPQPINYLHQS